MRSLDHIYGTLDHHRTKTSSSQPGLAVSWEAVDDLTWEFKLRDGVTFHDGNPLTADDVVFSFERAPDVPEFALQLSPLTSRAKRRPEGRRS